MSDRLGDILVERGLASSEAVKDALAEQSKKGGRLGEILTARKIVSHEAILQLLASQLDLNYVTTIDDKQIADELIVKVPINFAKQNCILPSKKTPIGVEAFVSDPYGLAAQDDLAMLLNDNVIPILAPPERIIEAINKVYDRGTAHAEAAMEELKNEDLTSVESDIEQIIDIIDAEDEAPIIRLVNSVLSQAVKEGASDIHIEPFEKELLIRFRIDGVLYNKISPPKKLQNSIVSRVKIMAGLNIAEKRLPQDGRIRIKIAGKDVDFRVATVPCVYGERITMRLLDRSSILLGLQDLGFAEDTYHQMDELVHKSYGIILVTGPTGSGKTTTLYACLNRINSPDLNIMTIEDPVEYQLPGISQVQVNSKIDLTFANGLLLFLRHDPDVIMVGEIRDRETAEIAIQASLTGHLVIATIHTNDAAGAVTRLVDMGIEPFLIASSLIGVLAQRLVRRVCKQCKESYTPTEQVLRNLNIDPKKLKEFPLLYRGKGCSNCVNTGYRGRTGIYELMGVDDDVRQLILQKVDAGTLKKAPVSKGMRTLREDGTRIVLLGQTTAEEMLSVTQEDA